MNLINNMEFNKNGGVCLIKSLNYTTYDVINSGCTCNETITNVENDYIELGINITPYKNLNKYYTVNTGDTNECLVIDMVLFNEWFIDYLNNLVSTGNTIDEYLNIEKRVIFDITTGDYYKIETDVNICSGDTYSRMAIVKYIDEQLWVEGDGSVFTSEFDECGLETGTRLIKLKDINPISPTFEVIDITEKCYNETEPITITNNVSNITTSQATLNGDIVSSGGYEIIERGFCYSFNRLPSINDNKLTVSGGIGSYNKIITNLIPNRYYYVRAYSSNLIGVSYGETKIFKVNS